MSDVVSVFENVNIDSASIFLMLGGARVMGIFYVSPIFVRTTMPRTIHTAVMVVILAFIFPYYETQLSKIDEWGVSVAGLFLKELALGTIFGVLLWLPLRGLEMVGVIWDTQRGATMGQMMDPAFSANTTYTSILLMQCFIGYFFVSGGFNHFVEIIINSFIQWEIDRPLPEFSYASFSTFIDYSGATFWVMVQVAAPISCAMIVADIVIALISKFAPSLNAMTLGMPIKSAIMYVLLAATIFINYPNVLNSFYSVGMNVPKWSKNE